jgi:hypothetical protein
MGATLVMLPPQTSSTRESAKRLAAALEAGEIAGAGSSWF